MPDSQQACSAYFRGLCSRGPHKAKGQPLTEQHPEDKAPLPLLPHNQGPLLCS